MIKGVRTVKRKESWIQDFIKGDFNLRGSPAMSTVQLAFAASRRFENGLIN